MSSQGFGSFNDSIARPDRSLQMIGAERTPIVERLFSLFVWDLSTQEIIGDLDIDPSGTRTKAEYYFRVPPKVHEMNEPFTTHITPTQSGGKYVESFGTILSEIHLSGTTGLRPKKQNQSQISVLNVSEAQLRALGSNPFNGQQRQVPASEVTGIDDIIMLRNLFRLYSDSKKDDTLSRSRVMVWRNVRTDDYWVVEPKDFKLVQNAQSPLTYQYTITLSALTRFDAAITVEPDPQQAARDRRRILSRVQGYSQNLSQVYLQIASSITRIQGAGFFGINTVLGPMLSTLRGLNEVKKSTEDAYRGLTAVTRDLSSEIITNLESLVDFLPAQDPVIRGLRRAQIICAHILSEDAFQDTATASVTRRRSRIESSYRTPATGTQPSRDPSTFGSSSYLSNEPRSSSVAQGEVMGGETIRDCARRLLGDARRWHILVVINDLRPPYISREGGDGVLRPGDAILYPSREGPSADVATISEVNPTNEEQGEGNRKPATAPLVRAYGRDIALQSIDSAFDIADIRVNNSGDFSTIAGIDNVEQAVKIKFAVEQGELPCHKFFGAKYPIGTKMTIASFNEFRINAISTLKSDARVGNINSLKFATVGDILTIFADLSLSKTRDSLQTNFALR